LGRWFNREDQAAAVISYSAWERFFRNDPQVIGKTIRSESHSYTVVGVAAPEFGGIYQPMRIDLWVPFRFWAGQRAARMRVMVFGALKHGVNVAQASAELNALATELRKEDLALAQTPVAPLSVEPVRGLPSPASRRQAVPVMVLLMVVVSIVLLIACANVGNLLLARGIGRQREVAVRFALGASRMRVLRHLMTENLTLCLAGGAAGIVFGYVCNGILQATVPALPFGEMMRFDLPLDFRVLTYTGLVALLTSVLSGLLPAWQGSRDDLAASLKTGSVTGGRQRLRLITLTAQITLSLVLLLTAGLFGRAALRLRNTDAGFATSGRLFAPVFVPKPQFTVVTAKAFYERTANRLRLLAGVKSVALTTRLPLYAAGIESTCIALDTEKPAAATTMTVGDGYLDTMQIPLVEGRDFRRTDEADGPAVAIVNQTLARRLWPNESAIGQSLREGCEHSRVVKVVGVAHDSRIRALNEAALPNVYLPFSQAYPGGIVFVVVQTLGDSGALRETIRKTLVSLHPDFRTYGVKRLSEAVEASFWQVRFEVWVLSAIGMLALTLAAVGMYGVMAYHVTVRTREIGIRMAVGAQRGDIFRLVMSQAARVTAVGLGAGLAVSAMAGRLLASLLYGVSPTDALTWSAAVAVWLIVAPLACWLPALRATHVEPMVALRQD
jgi:putative ABC transport system permease protein